MPRIDWTPGQGRRGRPLRRVLGMGQQQGLIVLSGIAVVMVLLAVVAALGGFNDDPPARAGAAGNQNDNGADGGSSGGDGAKDTGKAAQILLASVQHYNDLLTTGQKIVGTTHYASAAAYGKAYADPKSPAAAFAKFRVSPNPEGDSSYVEAASQARKAFGDSSETLDKWSRDMTKAKWDLADWVATASRFQQGAVPQAALDTAAAAVTQDLAAAKADAGALNG